MFVLGTLLSFVLAPIAFYSVVTQYFEGEHTEPDGAKASLFVIALGLAPAFISWILSFLLEFLPGQPDGFYISFITVIILLPYGVFWRRFIQIMTKSHRSILSFFRTKPQTPPLKKHSGTIAVAAIAIVFLLLNFWQTLSLPLYANDPLEYATVGRLIHQVNSTRIYPFTAADPVTGFYASSSHPLAYHCLIVWGYMLQGSANSTLFMKLIAPWYAAITAAAIVVIVRDNVSVRAGFVAAILFLSTPLYSNHVSIAHIDAMRVFLFFAPFLLLKYVLEKPTLKNKIILGMAVGFSVYGHSIGILALPFVGAIYVLFSREPLLQRLASVAIILLMGSCFGAQRYAQNLYEFGSILRDNEPVLELPQLRYNEELEYLRDIKTPFEKVVYGALRGLSQVKYFGLTGWLAIVSVFTNYKQISKSVGLKICGCATLFFVLLGLITILLGSSLVIKNPRYYLTVLPFVCCLAGVAFDRLFSIAHHLKNRRKRLISRIAVLLLLVPSLLQYIRYDVSPTLKYGDFSQTVTSADWATLKSRKYPGSNVLRYVREETDTGSKFLIFRLAEFAYYSERQYIRDIDPKITDFYSIEDELAAYRYLLDLGIDYVYVPSYQPETFTHSQIHKIVANPQISSLVVEDQSVRLFKLKQKIDLTIQPQKILLDRLSPNINVSTQAVFINYADQEPIAVETRQSSDLLTLLVNGQCPALEANYECAQDLTGPHRIQTTITPHAIQNQTDLGQLTITLIEYDQFSTAHAQTLWESILREGQTENISAQFNMDDNTKSLKILMRFKETGDYSVDNFDLSAVLAPSNVLDRQTEQAATADSTRTLLAQYKTIWAADFGSGKPNSIDTPVEIDNNLPSLMTKSHSDSNAVLRSHANSIEISNQNEATQVVWEALPNLFVPKFFISRELISCQDFGGNVLPQSKRCMSKGLVPFLQEDIEFRLSANVSGFGTALFSVTWQNTEGEKFVKALDNYYVSDDQFNRIDKPFYLPADVNKETVRPHILLGAMNDAQNTHLEISKIEILSAI